MQIISWDEKGHTFNLDDKIKVLDYKRDHQTIGVRQLGGKFNIGKTLKDAKQLQKDYETHNKASYEKRRVGKCHVIKWNSIGIVFTVLQPQCFSLWGNDVRRSHAGQRKTIAQDDLADFTASNGWLQSFKRIRMETRGLAEKVRETT